MKLWHFDMKILSILLALCEGSPPVSSGFHSQRASNVELFFYIILNVSLIDIIQVVDDWRCHNTRVKLLQCIQVTWNLSLCYQICQHLVIIVHQQSLWWLNIAWCFVIGKLTISVYLQGLIPNQYLCIFNTPIEASAALRCLRDSEWLKAERLWISFQSIWNFTDTISLSKLFFIYSDPQW